MKSAKNRKKKKNWPTFVFWPWADGNGMAMEEVKRLLAAGNASGLRNSGIVRAEEVEAESLDPEEEE